MIKYHPFKVENFIFFIWTPYKLKKYKNLKEANIRV